MAEVSQLINDIISQRKKTADEPRQKKEQLGSLASILNQLEGQKQALLQRAGVTPALVAKLQEIDFPILIDAIAEEQEVWENLGKRFERNSINIGVIGLARQGKSTFLQAVSGLTDNEIPSSDGQPCTTVQSNISHYEGVTTGVVHFHSEQSFLKEVIGLYYRELGFPNPPQTLTEFRNASLPPMPVNHGQSAKIESLYKHLNDEYYRNFDKYASFLKPEKWRKEISQNEIKEYVSQEYDSNSNPKFFNHLAVEKVEIACSFPQVDVQQIALVDMPGLGDTRLGDAERMISALSQDVDFILFVRRPREDGDYLGSQDTDLYDTAAKALKEKLPLEEWSFLLLNYDGKNRQRCKDFENTREQKGIRVKQCLIANCQNKVEANTVLEKILKYLVDHMERLDKQYMSASKSSLESLQFRVDQELKKAQELLEEYSDGHAEYVKLSSNFIKKLYSKIENFREELRSTKDQPNPYFKDQVDLAIAKCKENTGIPNKVTLDIRIPEKGINEAYFRSIQQVRTTFLQQFHSIGIGLKDLLNQTKSNVANLFIELGFGNFTEKQGTEFLQTMADNLPNELSNLKLGFNFISSFELSYQGFLQLNIWEEIETIFPPSPEESANVPNDLSGEEKRDFISAELKQSHLQAIDACQKLLDDFALSVTRVNISMVEEFADHITRADQVEKEWDIFLGKYRTQVWSEFADLEERKQLQQQWISIVKEAFQINQELSDFKTLNE